MKTFTQFLLEKITDTGHNKSSDPHFQADMVDLIRSHTPNANSEIMYASLNRPGKEKEYFNYYFNKLSQRYSMNALKDAKLYNGTNVTFYFHAPKIKPGHYIKVNAILPDESLAKEIFAEVTQKFKKKV